MGRHLVIIMLIWIVIIEHMYVPHRVLYGHNAFLHLCYFVAAAGKLVYGSMGHVSQHM